MNQIVIKIENLSKKYRLGYISAGTLRDDLQQLFSKIMKKDNPLMKIGAENTLNESEYEYIYALEDISLEVNSGEVLGIIGKNGAGKSTFLKILSKVTGPTTGTIKIKGKIASLLEVGTGFHPELTGRENVFLNGAILGMNKMEIKSKLEEIVDFAGVRKYIDTPVKRYSSGMHVRLAFAVAAHLEPDILIVDEVLAVGDAEFQRKAIGKMKDVSHNYGRTVLFVSHNMGAVSQLCSRAILLEDGKVSFSGDVNSTIDKYLMGSNKSTYYQHDIENDERDAYFVRIETVDQNLKPKTDFYFDEPVFLSYKIHLEKIAYQKYTVFCTIIDNKNTRIFSAESKSIDPNMTLKINPNFLVRGDYSIQTFIHIPRKYQIDTVENVCSFRIIDNGSPYLVHGSYDYGVVFGDAEWI